SLTDKVGAAVKPDSEKSTTEHVGDAFKGKSDNLASGLQPQGEKSTTQKAGDALSGNSTNESVLDKAKAALGMEKH
ncbi:heat shock protein 9/12-domain-containing protein, partial [Auriculariales sp. MPI-PUGE-AT-0066]